MHCNYIKLRATINHSITDDSVMFDGHNKQTINSLITGSNSNSPSRQMVGERNTVIFRLEMLDGLIRKTHSCTIITTSSYYGGGGGGGIAQSVERVTPGDEVPSLISVVAARCLLIGSVSG